MFRGVTPPKAGHGGLNRELGIPMAEIAREVGIGTTGVAMIIKRREEKNK
jgi:DNA-binding Lrp family transcriptional regulator